MSDEAMVSSTNGGSTSRTLRVPKIVWDRATYARWVAQELRAGILSGK
jgi:hypothetical protein